MNSQTRASSPPGSYRAIARTLLLLGLPVFCGVSLAPADGAAQSPAITVYHSSDPAGVDPRPTVAPGCDAAGTSGLVNGDFESGALAPWFQGAVFSGGEDWNVTSADSHTGVFSATNTGNMEIRQDLGAPISTDSIEEMSFWLKHPDPEVSAAYVSLFYTDGSTEFLVNTEGTDWNFFDVTGNLLPGRMLIGFSVYGNSAGDPEFARTVLDDVILASSEVGSSCVIQGGPDEALELWIDGGANPGGAGETVCKMGDGGGSGDQLCGVDLLLQLTGVGEFSSFDPDGAMDTLVCSPCSFDEELGLYLIPPGTQQLRVNFRRGDSSPTVGQRHLATLVMDSTGLVPPTVTHVTAFGEAAGAALQLRSYASAVEPELVATSDPTEIPEPGWLLQLSSGLLGLAALRRLRGG